ncbi:MAG: helix-turn-helix domain-containing protein [Lacunisphaera sp.]|nr:helix-turn-helix domain-containing protein [Lacunisphaera sp.]
MKHSIRQIIFTDLQARLPALAAARTPAARPSGGWLRAVRQALGQAQADVAKNTGVTKQAYAQYERGEIKGTLSLGSLQRAADAMQCDLVYYLAPRASSLGELATRFDPNFAHLQASEHSMTLEGQAVGDLPPPQTPEKK